jgi:GNAT superfamily N-acetyltransferase
LRIIRADSTHLDQIMEVWKEFMEYHQRIDAYYATVEGGPLKFREYISERISRDDSQVLVAIDGDRLLGYCLCYVKRRPPVFTEQAVGILSDLAVREDSRGGGAGGNLVEESLSWFRAEGIRRVELRTSARNEPTIDFYRKHGFWVYDLMMTREI